MGAAPPPPPPPRTHSGLALGVLIATTLALLLLDPPAPACPSGSCLHAVGGGHRHAGGAFPQHRVRSEKCWPSVEQYFVSGAYDADVKEAVDEAASVVLGRARPTRSQVIVLDIDETALSNRAEWLTSSSPPPPAWHPKSLAAAAPPPPPPPPVDLDAAALRGGAPPLAPTLAFYKAAHAAGFSLAFVTGRRDDEDVRAATVEALRVAGYGEQCAEGEGAGGDDEPASPSPCYVALHMRPPGDPAPASVVKPAKRAALVEAGYSIAAVLGDQFSDLAGGAPGDASFKLPNPVYYIL